MKTCEEYVLQELEAVQGKIAELKKDREKLLLNLCLKWQK